MPPAPGFEEVLVPGDPELRTRAVRKREGIPIPDDLWQQLVDLAALPGIVISDQGNGRPDETGNWMSYDGTSWKPFSGGQRGHTLSWVGPANVLPGSGRGTSRASRRSPETWPLLSLK